MEKLFEKFKQELLELECYRNDFEISYDDKKEDITIKFKYLTHLCFLFFAQFVENNNLLIMIAPPTINESKQEVVIYKKK